MRRRRVRNDIKIEDLGARKKVGQTVGLYESKQEKGHQADDM